MQPRIDVALKQSTSEAYTKMMKTAYELAMNPTMPLKHFKILIKCQRQNGVVLIEGRDSNKAAREYVHCISDAVREKCAAIIASQHFMSLMSDGSQARKTGSEKELIMVRVERNGIPCYLVLSLLEMSTYGGVDADSIKKGIDSIFSEEGVVPMSPEEYKVKMVSATADGASVNTGIYTGVLTQLAENRDWLLSIHCANHRVELAFKSAIGESPFKVCYETYMSVYTVLRNSGKLNNEEHAACKALGIENHKKLPKIHGTRFINHRRRGMKVLLDMLPGLVTAFENNLAERSGRAETKAKIRGLLKQLQSYEFVCKLASYVDILEAAGPSSLVFEGNGVMPYEIAESIHRTFDELNDLEENAGKGEELLNSHLGKFKYEVETKQVIGIYLKEGHGRRKPVNKENVDVPISGMHYSERAQEVAAAAKISTIKKVRAILEDRFPEMNSELFQAIKIYDPQYWRDEADFGVRELSTLLGRFLVPLSEAGINERDLFIEWRRFRSFARRNFGDLFKEPKMLWRRVLNFRRLEFPNLCLVIELVTCIAGSNSSVERAFSLLTLLLNDR